MKNSNIRVLIALAVLQGCAGRRAETAVAAVVSGTSLGRATPTSSAPLTANAVAPSALVNVHCERWREPYADWGKAFEEASLPFSAHRVARDNGSWSEARLTACERLRKKYVKPGRSQEHEETSRPAEPSEPEQTLDCYARHDSPDPGLWALLNTQPNARQPYQRWRAFHVDARGHEQSTPETPAAPGNMGTDLGGFDPGVPAGNNAPSAPFVVGLFDVDGDGSDELLTTTSEASDVCGNWFTRAQAYTSTPTRRMDLLNFANDIPSAFAFSDIDGDGRPEVLIDPYGSVIVGSDKQGSLQRKLTWSLLAEFGLRGELLLNGRLSRVYARELCPSPQRLLEDLVNGPAECVSAYAHCAKLWGRSQAEVKSALDAFCAREERDTPDDYLRWCKSSDWELIARHEPPFVLQ